MGIDESQVVPNRVTQSISAEDTIERDVLLAEAEPMIWVLAEKTWEASRKESRTARTEDLKLNTAEFQVLTRSQTPIAPLASCQEFTEIAPSLCKRAKMATTQRFRLVGVGLINFSDPEDTDESWLFD